MNSNINYCANCGKPVSREIENRYGELLCLKCAKRKSKSSYEKRAEDGVDDVGDPDNIGSIY